MPNLLRKSEWHEHRHGLRQVWKQMPLVAAFGLAALALYALVVVVASNRQSSPHNPCANKENTPPFLSQRGHGKRGDVATEMEPQRRRKVLGVVGIQTGFESVNRRKALRATWMPSTPEGISRLEEETGLVFRFVIGYTKDIRKMAALEKEIEQYNDFIRIGTEEDYHLLKHKTLAYFKAAYWAYDAEFYVKADDDIYLRPDRLATLLAKARPSERTYLGCMKKGPVISDRNQKWYEPAGYLLGNEYFLHAYGPIYALSNKVVEDIASSSDSSFRYFANEDVTVGVWMLSMNVDHEDNHALCHQQCKPDSVAVWDIPTCSGLCKPEIRMPELHQMEACRKPPSVPVD